MTCSICSKNNAAESGARSHRQIRSSLRTMEQDSSAPCAGDGGASWARYMIEKEEYDL